MLDAFIRLFESLSDPKAPAFLGELIVDEIYFRCISKAVEYIHQNLDQPVSVEGLAEMVHMGQTSFYENFRNVMHVSPLQ